MEDAMTDRPIIFSAPMVRALTFTVNRQNIDQLNKGATK